MALNWNLAGPGYNAAETLAAARDAQRDSYQWSRLARQEQAEQRRQAVQQQVGGRVAAGDYAGAANEAAAAGDFDLAKQIQGLGAEQQKRLAEEVKVAGQAAAGLRQIPADQRGAALRNYLPALAAAGLDEREVMSYVGDLSDGVLDGIINTTRSINDTFSANEPRYQAIPEGGTLVNTRDPRAVTAYQNGASVGTDDLEAQAQAAIAAGADPAAVRARLSQMRGGAGNGQRSFP